MRAGGTGLLVAALLAPVAIAAEDLHEDAVPQPTPREEQLEERVEELEQRLGELETVQRANEDATRAIIRQAISEWGAKINEYVTFGGTVEFLGGWGEDFSRKTDKEFRLDTAELDFEVQVTDWAVGSLVVQYDDGSRRVFPTVDEDEASVDRVNVDTALVRLGDVERFWPYAVVGRQIVPFGLSTGDPVADVLSIEGPLTIEAFETKEDAILVGFAFPTPPLGPPVEVEAPPPVRPVAVRPLVGWLARALGYDPIPVIPTKSFTTLSPPPPPFRLAAYTFDGRTRDRLDNEEWQVEEHWGAMAGFQTRGDWWTLDANVQYTNTIFDSNFLDFEYRAFLPQIDFLPGAGAVLRTSFGPVSLIGEWNVATETASLVDDLGRRFSLQPQAWQVSLGYQFAWKPWVKAIGAEGTYLTVGYSESEDLHGVIRVINGENVRVGNVPRRRFIVGAGEWITENVRIAVEYTRAQDYSKRRGGTNRHADTVFSMLTFEW